MGRGRTVVEAPTCFHALTEESVSRRWEQIERQIGATLEDDHDAQWSVVQWCACCCGPSKSELCSRCQELTDEQYAALMGLSAEKAGAA